LPAGNSCIAPEYIIESPDSFQFYDDGRLHQQVGGIFADDDLS
jgi:hypothetical protein